MNKWTDYNEAHVLFTAKEKGIKPKTKMVSFYVEKSKTDAIIREEAITILHLRNGSKAAEYALTGLNIRPCTG